MNAIRQYLNLIIGGVIAALAVACLILWFAMGKAKAEAGAADAAKKQAIESLAAAEADNRIMADRLAEARLETQRRIAQERLISEQRRQEAVAAREELENARTIIRHETETVECLAVPYSGAVVEQLRWLTARANGLQGSASTDLRAGSDSAD